MGHIFNIIGKLLLAAITGIFIGGIILLLIVALATAYHNTHSENKPKAKGWTTLENSDSLEIIQ